MIKSSRFAYLFRHMKPRRIAEVVCCRETANSADPGAMGRRAAHLPERRIPRHRVVRAQRPAERCMVSDYCSPCHLRAAPKISVHDDSARRVRIDCVQKFNRSARRAPFGREIILAAFSIMCNPPEIFFPVIAID